MKKTTILLLLLSLQAFSQKLIKDEVDEFTGKKLKRTDWLTLDTGFMEMEVRYSLVKVDSTYAVNIKILDPKVYHSISKGNELMFKLANGEIIQMHCDNSATSCIGCGSTGFIGSKALGLTLYFPFTDEQFEALKQSPVSKIRLYLNDGYKEIVVTEKRSKKFTETLNLLD